jgi:hypothetical protein
MTPDKIGVLDVALKNAGAGVDEIGHNAIGFTQPDTPGATVDALRAALENGTLTTQKEAGVGVHADHSA